MKYSSVVRGSSFTVSGISTDSHVCDTDSDRFCFTVYGIEPLEFFNVLDKLIEDHEKDAPFGELTATIGTGMDKITMVLRSNNLHMNRGGLKILYSGWARNILGAKRCVMRELSKYLAVLHRMV